MARKTKAEKATEATKTSTAPIVELPAGTGTQNEPLAYIPGQKQRSDQRVEQEEPVEDTKRLQRDKARWDDGATPAELSAEQKQIDAEQEETE